MKKCNQKIKHTCGNIVFADCTSYEGTINSDSELDGNSCLTIEETTQDIYNQLENLDLSALGELCLDYVTVEGKNIVKNVLLKHEEKICELESIIKESEATDICNKIITSCNLDFGDLVTACGDQPTTLAEVLQIILTQLNTP